MVISHATIAIVVFSILAGMAGFAWEPVAAASALVTLASSEFKAPVPQEASKLLAWRAYLSAPIGTLLLGAGQSCFAWSAGMLLAMAF